jgi:hypothetical protein
MSHNEDEDDLDDDDSMIFEEDHENWEDTPQGCLEPEDDFEEDLEEDDDDEDYYEDEEDDLDDEDEEDVVCHLCCDDQVEAGDRWKFTFQGTSEEAFLCRTCHGRFNDVDEFNKFNSSLLNVRLYRAAARLQKLLLLGAPAAIIANTIFGSLVSVLFSKDYYGGSKDMRDHARYEFESKAKRILEEREE